MRKSLCFLFLLIGGLFASLNSFAAGQGAIQIITNSGPQKFQVEYAISPQEKAKGLMFRKTLAKKSGMMFIYQTPSNVTMWMKDTPISLDMFFINSKGRIRYIEEKTQPNSIRQIHSGGKVSAVLEFRAGTAEDYGIKIGDQVVLPK